VSAAGPLHVGLKDGKTVVGAVTTAESGKLEIATKDAGVVTTDKGSVAFIRTEGEQAVYERFHHPHLTDLWTGFLDLGYATSQGNSKTSSFAFSGNASRTTVNDKISMNFTSLFSSSNASGKNITTANAKRGGVAYDRNFNPRWYAFGSADLESDEFQNLDLRFSPAAGIGSHVVKTDTLALDMQAGGDLDREIFSTGLHRTSGEFLVGEEFSKKMSKATSIHQKLGFFSDGGDYRLNFDASSVTTLKKWLSWQVTASDRLLSNPVAGRKRNDIILTTGLRISFSR
jgi:putative salt-induced outer membrane protein YdiY